MHRSIPITQLQPNPQRVNYLSTEKQQKLTRNIERSGLYPPVIVWPIPEQDGCYRILDGHARVESLKTLGYTEVSCQVWDVSEQEALTSLATLNALRGTEDRRKRAELLDTLIQWIPVEDLSAILPESSAEIHDLLALLTLQETELKKEIQRQMESERAALPVPYTFMVASVEVEMVEKALGLYPSRDEAFLSLCRLALEGAASHE